MATSKPTLRRSAPQQIAGEEWRDIPEYKGKYQVSNHGKVRSLARDVPRKNGCRHRIQSRIKRLSKTRRGYILVTLNANSGLKTYRVHVLVMAVFVGPRPNGYEINHKDGNKENNRLDNLEYLTQAANWRHAIDVLKRPAFVPLENHCHAKYTIKQILRGYELVKAGMTYTGAAKLVDMNMAVLHDVCRGRSWKELKLEPLPRKLAYPQQKQGSQNE